MKKYEIIDPEIELAKHQLRAIDFIIRKRRCLINYGTGSGKTFICLESIFQLLADEEIEKALIVCTKSSVLSFEGNIQQTNYPFKKLITIKDNSDIEKIYLSNKYIFLIQYETLLTIDLIKLKRAFKAFDSGLFIDEVHRVKTAGQTTGKGKKSKASNTARNLVVLKSGFTYLIGLTATAITSKLEDGYRVIDYIAPGTLGGIKWFKKTFCNYTTGSRYVPKLKKYIEYPKLIGYKNLDKFLKYTKDVVIQYFPDLDFRFHVLSKSLPEGSKRQQKYNELAISTHGRNKRNHTSVMPKLERLLDKSPTKKFLLKKIIEQTRDNGLIIYSRTRKEDMLDYIKSICEEEGLQVKIICGSTKKQKREDIIKWAFEGSPKDKCIIGTQAMGQSLNLHWTCNLCYFELPKGPGQYDQVKGRIGRMFSKWKEYHFWFMLIKNTIEEYWYLKMTSNKEMIGFTSDSSAIPQSKLNTYNERKLKKERDLKIWKKDLKGDEGGAPLSKNLLKTKRLNKH